MEDPNQVISHPYTPSIFMYLDSVEPHNQVQEVSL